MFACVRTLLQGTGVDNDEVTDRAILSFIIIRTCSYELTDWNDVHRVMLQDITCVNVNKIKYDV